ncbi:thioredoxin-like protein [Aspergillus campestris IBT 28561]|uniref:Thioredoxin-like protein n=1 Tax=Aspergillus campestris (strain IBT 28561) TaxID=1392248 RepID=A0A2I1D670_ASPC2|nr:thioredoxin-like protein [Aspergillus campestris IBT 28561]PKY05372.1 thioredoxin-like protein [Aspergillus campestris IBT 28561]
MTTKQAPRDLDGDLTQEDDAALFAALENEDDSLYRAQRIEQLNAEYASAQHARPSGPTTLIEDNLLPTIETDQALLNFTTQMNRCVIHFAHPDFARCKTMDEHMRTLAARHHEVRFARADVRSTAFVVEKLKIKVLPCVIGFRDGIAVERVIGTATLEKRLLWKGILTQSRVRESEVGEESSDGGSDVEDENQSRRNGRGAIRSGGMRHRQINDDDDDDDWD